MLKRLPFLLFQFIIYCVWGIIFAFIALNVRKRKRGCSQNIYGGINEVCFLGFKLYCCAPPQLFKVIFYSWKFLLDQMFFSLHSTGMRFNLISLQKYSSNKTNFDTVWKTEIKDSVTVFFAAIYCESLKFY